MEKFRLGDIGTIITGNTPKTSDNQNYASSDISFVKPSDIDDNELTDLHSSEYHISEYARDKARILPPQSILVTCIGIVGKVGINAIECAFNQQINAIIPDSRKCNYRYLAYAIQHEKPKLQSIANAPVVPILNKSQFSDIQVPLPPLEEQRKIAAVLDKVSDLIAKRRQQLDKLDELVKARFVEMFGSPILNSLGWKKEFLKDVCTKLNDGTHFSPESFETGEYKYITAKNIKMSGFDFTNITYVPEEIHRPIYERCNPELGDVLYIKDGATTGIAMVNTLEEEFTLLSSVALLKQDRKRINGYFLAALLNNEDMYADIRRNMGGAAITRLTIAKLNTIQVILPPINLQNQFASFVERTEKTKITISKSLEKLETLKKALMQEYFEGEEL